jgi:hypothetical protein
MASSEEQAHALAAIVDAAQALLRGVSGVIAVARIIDANAHVVDPDMNDEELLTFKAIDDQSDHLAVGEMLENWHPTLRDAKRREVEEFEAFYREQACRVAAALVKRYGSVT